MLVIEPLPRTSLTVALATSAGHVGRSNEDFLGALPQAVVLLDGAGGIPGAEEACRHGVGWYTQQLGGALLGRLSRESTSSPADVLGGAIEQVAGLHRTTCDLADPRAPHATVALLRIAADRLDYLMLADSHLLLSTTTGNLDVITDAREVDVRRAVTARLDKLETGSGPYDAAVAVCREELRSRRNSPGGYWIAQEDPRVAAEAVSGSMPVAQLRDAAVLSNGVTRLVEPYAQVTWSALLDHCRSTGPDGVIDDLRHYEAEHSALTTDDASIAYCSW